MAYRLVFSLERVRAKGESGVAPVCGYPIGNTPDHYRRSAVCGGFDDLLADVGVPSRQTMDNAAGTGGTLPTEYNSQRYEIG